MLSGETARTSGHLSSVLELTYPELKRLHGHEGARAAAQSHKWAINHVHQTTTLLGMEGSTDFRLVAGYRVSQYAPTDPRHVDDLKAIREKLNLARDLGLDVEFSDGIDIDG